MLKHRWMGFVSFKGCKCCVKLRVELNLEAKRRSPTLRQCLLWPEWYWLKCTCWPQRQTFFFFLPNLCLPLHTCCVYVSLSHTHTYTHNIPFFLCLCFLAVSCRAEANEGWLRLLWLLQGHRLHGRLQRRMWTAVSSAACAPRRWPQFQQRAHVLRVRITCQFNFIVSLMFSLYEKVK